MSNKKIQFIFSLLFLVGYITLLIIILTVEISDSVNMEKGENSLMGEVKILLGVLTGAVGQILNFWFNSNTNNDSNSLTQANI
ncbi:hypothetical protein [Tenacibaculum sp. nBUS_03]|uniref:hypothetical protein n=1 Tax=Tenacibaculum sp. nBUS_03 TaxID=3395320 RepID=UPI003EBAD3C1